MDLASHRRWPHSAGASFVVVAGASFVVVAEIAPPSGIVESVEATSVCTASFDPNNAPKNLFANEPWLSVQGTGGSCGSCNPFVRTIASGIILPGKRARKTLF